jgi:T4 RnlA family RNA ligase
MIKSILGQYRDEVEEIVRRNYTVNFEYTSPLNQIVLFYSKSKLSVLSIRCHSNGDTLFGDRLISFLQENRFSAILENIVSFKTVPNSITHQELIEDIRKETGGEGYVVEIIPPNQKSYLVKVKTEKYLRLHHTRFSSCSSWHFFQCVIYEQTDDLRSLYTNAKDVLEKIQKIEDKTRPIYNQLVQTIELFYEENKHLSRKDYAIKVVNTTQLKIYMPLIMNLYLGKENDYKKFSINHMKDIFHIDDENDLLIGLNNDT